MITDKQKYDLMMVGLRTRMKGSLKSLLEVIDRFDNDLLIKSTNRVKDELNNYIEILEEDVKKREEKRKKRDRKVTELLEHKYCKK